MLHDSSPHLRWAIAGGIGDVALDDGAARLRGIAVGGLLLVIDDDDPRPDAPGRRTDRDHRTWLGHSDAGFILSVHWHSQDHDLTPAAERLGAITTGAAEKRAECPQLWVIVGHSSRKQNLEWVTLGHRRCSGIEYRRINSLFGGGLDGCPRQDSNLRPSAPEADALSPELRGLGTQHSLSHRLPWPQSRCASGVLDPPGPRSARVDSLP